MGKKVSITLRIDYGLGELLLEVEGEVEAREDVTTLLGFMATLIKDAAKYGGTWVPSTKLRESNPMQIHHTCTFPNQEAKEQFYKELLKRARETVP